MREVFASEITETVKSLFLKLSCEIPEALKKSIKDFADEEEFPAAKFVLNKIIENYKIAEQKKMPLCQDCGMAVVFAEIGQDVHINGDFEEAVNQGVREAYTEGYLRKSVVFDPLLDRENTRDNTPAVIFTRLVSGEGAGRIKIKASAKGFGSENMSQVKFLLPTASSDDFKNFVVSAVKAAGPNACPPYIVGVGVGGTLEKAALLAKHATTRDVGSFNPDPRYARIEKDIIEEVNRSGIGPGGFGGKTSALAVHIEYFPTHIASLPVVVNICCHVARHAEAEI